VAILRCSPSDWVNSPHDFGLSCACETVVRLVPWDDVAVRKDPREVSNIRSRAWWQFVARAGYEWVTFRTFRKTVATRLDEAGLTARQIADILGHAHPSMTQDVYMVRGMVSRKGADALDATLAQRGKSVTKRSDDHYD
jgi:integrase